MITDHVHGSSGRRPRNQRRGLRRRANERAEQQLRGIVSTQPDGSVLLCHFSSEQDKGAFTLYSPAEARKLAAAILTGGIQPIWREDSAGAEKEGAGC